MKPINQIIQRLLSQRTALRLTDAQVEVLELQNKGMSNKDIGKELGICTSQVHNRVRIAPAMIERYIINTENGRNKLTDRHLIDYGALEAKVRHAFLSLHFQPEYWEDVALMYPYIRLVRNVGAKTMEKINALVLEHTGDTFTLSIFHYKLKLA